MYSFLTGLYHPPPSVEKLDRLLAFRRRNFSIGRRRAIAVYRPDGRLSDAEIVALHTDLALPSMVAIELPAVKARRRDRPIAPASDTETAV